MYNSQDKTLVWDKRIIEKYNLFGQNEKKVCKNKSYKLNHTPILESLLTYCFYVI